MSVHTIGRQAALIVIDLQKGIIGFPTAHPAADVVERAASLARAFRSHSLPVVLVNVIGIPPGRVDRPMELGELPVDFAELVPELDQQGGDHLLSKRSWGAFTATGLERLLRDLGVTQVVIAGIATSAGVETTSRQAYELGFDVVLPVDAMTDMSAHAHDNSANDVFPRIAQVCHTQDIHDLLAQS
jgi:nicotinamidase-related amidase